MALRKARHNLMAANGWSLREIYRSLELPGDNPIKDAQSKLDETVDLAYGFRKDRNPLESLLALNLETAEAEADGKAIVAPGLPPCVKSAEGLISEDAVQMPTP